MMENIQLENHSQDKREKVYSMIGSLYEYLMVGEGRNTVRWTGYASSIGFPVEEIGYFEPSLQRLLSLLHLNKDKPEFFDLVKKSISSLRNFDYKKQVLPEYQEDFIKSGTLEVIKKVADDLEKSFI